MLPNANSAKYKLRWACFCKTYLAFCSLVHMLISAHNIVDLYDRLSKLTAKAPGLIQPISGSCRYTSLHELRKPYYWEGICANMFVIAAAAESWKDAARI